MERARELARWAEPRVSAEPGVEIYDVNKDERFSYTNFRFKVIL